MRDFELPRTRSSGRSTEHGHQRHRERNTAYHEAGRTPVAAAAGTDPIHKVTIIPRVAPSIDPAASDRRHLSPQIPLNNIAILLGGGPRRTWF